MNNKSLLKYLVITSVVLGTGLLYILGFFIPEERVSFKTEAYIDGATPPSVEEWGMY